LFFIFFFSMHSPPLTFTLFSYTRLFRSHSLSRVENAGKEPRQVIAEPPVSRPEKERMRPGDPEPRMENEINEVVDRQAASVPSPDRKSTRLNSSHDQISYAVFCLKKKKK